ncbi:hypothetical protein QQZ08_006842 [Neonectria magnoliae]|uniref:Mitochondrial import inner membrane translocase subunit TIM50 n=1 Tax=Neonectria magnoliae TaxID=2732573 RepID=A0ABR1I0R5_9HYPO
MSLLRKLKASAKLGAVAGGATLGSFYIWTADCRMQKRPKAMDAIMQSPIYQRLNPIPNPAYYDRCTRFVDYSQIKPELLEDARSGGSKLVSAFGGGVWGSLGFSLQRKIMESIFRDEQTAHQLWDVDDILQDDYNQGREFLAHFNVLTRTPSSILFRCGDFPSVAANGPRANDGLVELSVVLEPEKQRAEFRFDSVMFQGANKIDHDPPLLVAVLVKPFMTWGHQQYVKLLVETGIHNVLR